jgi:hypothetical protein
MDLQHMKKLCFLFLALFTSCLQSAPADFSVNVDYLLWKPSQSNMTYGLAIDTFPTVGNMRPLNQCNQYASAVRLGIGYDLPCLWDTHFYWTHLNNHVTGSSSSVPVFANQLNGTNDLFALGGNGVGGPTTSKWSLNFDTFDLDFGRTICVWQGFRVRPLIGLKGAVINQDQRISYTNFLDVTLALTDRINGAVRQDNDFSGVGPKAGFSAAYDLGWGFDLVGDFSASALYGTHKSNTGIQVEDFNTQELLSTYHFIDNQNRLIPTAQLSLGINWNTCFYGCYNLTLGVAYETQYFWNTWRTRNSGSQDLFVTNVSKGDLMFQGVTFRLGVAF